MMVAIHITAKTAKTKPKNQNSLGTSSNMLPPTFDNWHVCLLDACDAAGPHRTRPPVHRSATPHQQGLINQYSSTSGELVGLVGNKLTGTSGAPVCFARHFDPQHGMHMRTTRSQRRVLPDSSTCRVAPLTVPVGCDVVRIDIELTSADWSIGTQPWPNRHGLWCRSRRR